MKFPVPLEAYKPLKLDPAEKTLGKASKEILENNISLLRDAIVFFTACAGAKGLGGHTGGAYDIVPEMLIIDGLRRGGARIHPINFDEAGHRVAIHYLMAALDKKSGMSISDLLHYREYDSGLPGHPEIDAKKGIQFSSGRLGHMWGHANGVAEQNHDIKIALFCSDGSQEEGNDAEAARYAVANNLKMILLVDDNNVTIEGHPQEYMKGFSIARTLEGHGMAVDIGNGEDTEKLYERVVKALSADRPIALVNKRPMAVGIMGVEGSTKAHDVIATEEAAEHLRKKGYGSAADYLSSLKDETKSAQSLGSSKETYKPRSEFGNIICEILSRKKDAERKKVLVISNDLGGSCGLSIIGQKYPSIYRKSGVMERNNFLVGAGFGSKDGYQGIYGTFSVFMEMIISEIAMSGLNKANVLAHFSHAGIDDMADNTCHFGINNFFAMGGFENSNMLYFPADRHQMKAILEKVFDNKGLRFIFSSRSSVPDILDENRNALFAGNYAFTGKDEIIREGKKGCIVSYGEMLHRCLHVAEEFKGEIALLNKPLLNQFDNSMLDNLCSYPFVLVVESQSINSGLGIMLGAKLLEKGYRGKYSIMGSSKHGKGGLSEQLLNQGLDIASIRKMVKKML